jgi:hypothetical protein
MKTFACLLVAMTTTLFLAPKKDIDGNVGVVGYTDSHLTWTDSALVVALADEPDLSVSRLILMPSVDQLWLVKGDDGRPVPVAIGEYANEWAPGGPSAGAVLMEGVGEALLHLTTPGMWAVYAGPAGEMQEIARIRTRMEGDAHQSTVGCEGGIEIQAIGTNPSGYTSVGKVKCCKPDGCVLELRPNDNPSQIINVYMSFQGESTYNAGLFIGSCSCS